MKRCTTCGVEKDLDDFHRAKKYIDGHVARCKTCTLAYHKHWYQKHLGYRIPQIALWRAANPDKCERYHRKTGLRKYGLTPEQYADMLRRQNGQCKICGTTRPGARFKHMPVDHDRDTGRVRGLLCDACNRGIGLLKHNPAILTAAITYLS